MRKTGILLTICLVAWSVSSQKRYMTKEGYISFFSHTLVEDIKADNNQALSIIDMETGEMAIQVLMRSFQFKKALMQQHFNDSYVESHKFPKARFNGQITNLDALDANNPETEIRGTLEVHGKQKEISVLARVENKDNKIRIYGDFTVEVADFDIKIPSVVRNNIARTIKVTFDLEHELYTK